MSITGTVRVMTMMNKAQELASEIKLLLKDFNQREVSFITGYSTASISRIATGRALMFKNIPVADKLVHYADKVRIVFELRKVKGIPGSGTLTKRDSQYMKILKLVGTDLPTVKQYYADIPPGDVRNAWNYCQNYGFSEFDFKLLGLEENDILILKGLLGVS